MSALKSLTVELPEEQVRLIEEQVASGAYASISEVVSAGVTELHATTLLDDMSPEWLAFVDRVQETCRRLDDGREPLLPIDDVRRRIAARRAEEDRLTRLDG